MLKPALRWVLFCALACVLPSPAQDLPGLDGVPAVVADVNGRPVHRDDLIREMAGSGATQAFDRVARRILVELAAARQGVAISDADIEAQFQDDKRRLAAELVKTPWAKEREFPTEEIIRAHFGLSIPEYKSMVIRQRLLTRRCVGQDIKATPRDVFDFFQKQNERFQPPTMYNASHILISPLDMRDLWRGLRSSSRFAQQDAYEAERRDRINTQRDDGVTFKDEGINLAPEWMHAKQMAERVLNQIRTGQIDWDSAVRKYTKDPLDQPLPDPITGKVYTDRQRDKLAPGELGWFNKRGPLVPQFFAGVRDMKPGDIGGPVKTPYGYHIVKMLEIRQPPVAAFDGMREQVERAYIEDQIQQRGDKWMSELFAAATMQFNRTQLWPPVKRATVLPDAGNAPDAPEERDPVVGIVNGVNVKRSDVWRELLRADGEEALKRLINLEIVMTLLKENGLERLDWECADPSKRSGTPPAARPIRIKPEIVDLELNEDRLRQELEAPDLKFRDYIQVLYGQSVDEYKRKIEAGLVVREAVRRKIPIDEGTLQVQFALGKENYAQPEWYTASHILIVPTGGMDKADANAQLQARTIAEEVYRMFVNDPKSFRQLVIDFSADKSANKSQGGKIGECHPDRRNIDYPEAPLLWRELRKQGVQKDQASTPIRTFRGYHIVRVDHVHPARPALFEEVKYKVERDYLHERAKMYADIWLRSLTERAQIVKHIFNKELLQQRDPLPPDNFKPPTK